MKFRPQLTSAFSFPQVIDYDYASNELEARITQLEDDSEGDSTPPELDEFDTITYAEQAKVDNIITREFAINRLYIFPSLSFLRVMCLFSFFSLLLKIKHHLSCF